MPDSVIFGIVGANGDDADPAMSDSLRTQLRSSALDVSGADLHYVGAVRNGADLRGQIWK